MTKSLRHRGWISWTPLRAAPALAFVLALATATVQSGQAQTFTLLYTFPGSKSGANPEAGLTRDFKGNLYGSTFYGGADGFGMAFRLSPAGVYALLHQFKGPPSDGTHPLSLLKDTAGNLYGTTYGGAYNGGTVFELKPTAGGFTENILHNFPVTYGDGDGDGSNPNAGLIFDASGNLYGTTVNAGNDLFDRYKVGSYGTVFELTHSASGWAEMVLHSFIGAPQQRGHPPLSGAYPRASLIFDAAGNLYGTTFGGGAYGDGTVFELTPSAGGWTETVLHSFDGTDGSNPSAGLIFDAAGNLYGTTFNGGGSTACTNGCGTVFELRSSASGWKETMLYAFIGGTDGAGPGGLVLGAHGNLYGTTFNGGGSTACADGCGTVFNLNTARTESVLYRFTGGTDGAGPNSGLIRDAAGNLYDTTQLAGADKRGTVFMITP